MLVQTTLVDSVAHHCNILVSIDPFLFQSGNDYFDKCWLIYPLCPWPIFVPVFLLVAVIVVFCCIYWQIRQIFFSVSVLIHHLHSQWYIHSLNLAFRVSVFSFCLLVSLVLHSLMVFHCRSCWWTLQPFCLMAWLIQNPCPLLSTNLISSKVV